MGDTTAVLKVSSACIGQTKKKIKGAIMNSNNQTADPKCTEKKFDYNSQMKKNTCS